MFYFGVDYYPEHWPESRWPIDARLMQEAGFNVVRLAEFAWSRLEPRAGEFDFAWLDRAIDVLARHGMQVVLGTPTASPPPWVMQRQPELFRVRADGMRVTYGNRRTYCPTNETYHALSRRIVAAMAEHYRDHPAVIGWQIDNEFGERCFCPSCQRAFQAWLRSRHETLAAVNERWGTVFWSHVYEGWDEIPVPLATGASPNPGLALDYARFCSDAYVGYQQLQIDILRAACPRHWITHNFMGFGFDQIDYFDLARPLDMVSWDNYPRMQWAFAPAPNPSRLALGHATMRGLKQKNFWVMEQQAGQGGWEWLSVAPRPGELRLWAYQAIAHGADGIVFFRWRTAQVGTEQYWHGLLDHDGSLSRRYAEIKAMGRELAAIGDRLAGAEVKAEVALVLSYPSRFAFQIQANNPAFSYADHFLALYQAFHRLNVAVDVVPPTADLSGYKLVVAPALHVVTEAEAARLRDFVAAGGTLAVTQRSGVKDEANRVVGWRLPGLLAELCGVEVEEYDSLAPGMANAVRFLLPAFAGAADAAVGILCDILHPTTATAAAEYVADYYAGKPAVTLNQFGRGHAVYLGAVGSVEFYATMAPWLLTLADVAVGPATTEGVELCVRWQAGRRILFALNHADGIQTLELAAPCRNLLGGEVAGHRLTLAPKGLAILEPATSVQGEMKERAVWKPHLR